MSQQVIVDTNTLADTLRELSKRSWWPTERVALWLGERGENAITVRELYVPKYEASSDYFYIPRTSMAALMSHLREARLMIAAQLHTHPMEAFHSAADDTWAIVRHAGALSVVIPEFGQYATPGNFVDHAKVFCLSRKNDWQEIPRADLSCHLEVVQ